LATTSSPVSQCAGAIDDAEGAQPVTLRASKRDAGVEPKLGVARDKGIVVKTRIERGVGHDHRFIVGDGVSAKGNIAPSKPGIEIIADTQCGGEENVLAVDQIDHRHRHIEHARGKSYDRIKRWFAGMSLETIRRKRKEAGFLILQWTRWPYGPSPPREDHPHCHSAANDP
jgi:hypothetical protein